jgi:hypothetical protein
MGEMRNGYNILVRKPEGKRPLGRPRHRWDNFNMDLKEMGWEDVEWIYVDPRSRPVAVSFVHSKQPLDSIKDRIS